MNGLLLGCQFCREVPSFLCLPPSSSWNRAGGAVISMVMNFSVSPVKILYGFTSYIDNDGYEKYISVNAQHEMRFDEFKITGTITQFSVFVRNCLAALVP